MALVERLRYTVVTNTGFIFSHLILNSWMTDTLYIWDVINHLTATHCSITILSIRTISLHCRKALKNIAGLIYTPSQWSITILHRVKQLMEI